MKLSVYRDRLTTWFEDNVVVSSFGLAAPEEPGDSVGHIAPLRDVEYSLEDTDKVLVTATQDLFVLRKHDGATRYHDLNWATLYGLYQTLAIRIVHSYRDINPEFLEVAALQVASPIQTIEEGDERRDWLLQFHWAFRWTALADPEVGQVQPPFQVSQVISGLWRSSIENKTLEKETSVLDSRLDFTVP